MDDLVDMMRQQDELVERATSNYDMTGSKIKHAKFSVRETLEARESAPWSIHLSRVAIHLLTLLIPLL